MEDIILNSVSINELKKTKLLIQRDASKFVSNAIESVKSLVNQIVELAEQDEVSVIDVARIDDMAMQAKALLDSAELVSGVSGVQYYLDYNEDWGSTGDVLSRKLEDVEALDSYGAGAVASLYGTLEDMESTSRNWHTSTCY